MVYWKTQWAISLFNFLACNSARETWRVRRTFREKILGSAMYPFDSYTLVHGWKGQVPAANWNKNAIVRAVWTINAKYHWDNMKIRQSHNEYQCPSNTPPTAQPFTYKHFHRSRPRFASNGVLKTPVFSTVKLCYLRQLSKFTNLSQNQGYL